MAVIAPTPINPGPPVPSSTDPQETFDAMYEAFNSWERNDLQPGANAVASNVYNNATVAEMAAAETQVDAAQSAASASAAATSATNAATSASAASTSQSAASGSASAANTSATNAATSAGAAATSATTASTAATAAVAARDQAQVYATQQLIATSSSSVAVGAGSKSFTIEPSKAFVVGMYLSATSSGTPANRMTGTITSYNASTGALVLSVDAFSGTGSSSDWVFGVAAPGGVQSTPYADIGTNTSAGAFGRYRFTASLELTLPASPLDGTWVDIANTSGTITPKIMRNGQNIEGLAEDMTIDRDFIPFRLVFRSGYGWMIV